MDGWQDSRSGSCAPRNKYALQPQGDPRDEEAAMSVAAANGISMAVAVPTGFAETSETVPSVTSPVGPFRKGQGEELHPVTSYKCVSSDLPFSFLCALPQMAQSGNTGLALNLRGTFTSKPMCLRLRITAILKLPHFQGSSIEIRHLYGIFVHFDSHQDM